VHSAIQADETASPAKKVSRRHVSEDTDEVVVQELTEGDVGYAADSETVYPHELEEVESSSDTDSPSESEGGDDESDSGDGIADQLSRLECEDDAEVEFEKKRREKHVRRRTNSRVFKRPHSLTINPEMEVVDSDAMGDHDLPESARRLRRRVRGPAEEGEEYNDSGISSPEPGSGRLAPAAEIHDQRTYENDGHVAGAAAHELMDLDEDSDD
jgi:hypothetical protein